MYDDCVHAIDTVRWMNGGECIGIQSKMKSVGVPDLNFITAILTFDNGSTGIIINSWSSGKRIFSVEMHAPGIYVEAEHEDKAYVWKDGNLTPEIYKTEEVAGSDQYFISSGVQLKARNFVDCCRSKQLCDSAFQDAIKTVRIAEKILAQNTLENE
jgi:predicted dehydrogenase